MKYKHDEVIRAWLDGKTVQYLQGCEWIDVPPVGKYDVVPDFDIHWEYRIKPKPKPDVVRYVNVYEFSFGPAHCSICSAQRAEVKAARPAIGTLKYTIDGETGKLKSAEVV